ncbi:MAG: hypothetical protein GF311_23720 [Candidatus Lokiarchaeota archaeon]|nr:hypothetical protein [Candidatus Lokiarchaeota archaeon]
MTRIKTMNRMFFESRAYQVMLFNLNFRNSYRQSEELKLRIETFLQEITNVYQGHLSAGILEVHSIHDHIPPNLNLAILDFEGSPAIHLGVLLYDTIYMLTLLDYEFDLFYRKVIELLSILVSAKILLFGFSNWDYDVITNIFGRESIDLRVNNIPLLSQFFYFNLQEHDKESLSEAIYSIHEELEPDPLFRNSKNINELHLHKYYQIIRQHNRSCLLNEVKILKNRFLKKNLIRILNKYEVKPPTKEGLKE